MLENPGTLGEIGFVIRCNDEEKKTGELVIRLRRG